MANVTTGRMLTEPIGPSAQVFRRNLGQHLSSLGYPLNSTRPTFLQTSLIALCIVISLASCKERSGVADSPADPPHEASERALAPASSAPPPTTTDTSPTATALAPVVAVVVNGTTIYQSEIAATAVRLGVALKEARNLTVQAEVVAREARSAGFPGAAKNSHRFELSRQFLETVYSEETLCSNITSRQIEELYEFSYRPEWPVDVYQGDLIEVRCCQRLDRADCDAVQLATCMQRHAPLMEQLLPVAKAWREGGPLPIELLKKSWPSLVVTDFGMLDWPSIPLERKRPRELFPESIVNAVKILQEGEVAGPIRSDIGIHLFKLSRRRGAIESTSPEFRQAARAAICKHRIEQTRWDYVKRLLEGAVVEVPGEERTPPGLR
jgi:hypothetical protein